MPSTKKAMAAVDVFELQELARRRLPKAMYSALQYGCEDDVSLDHNRQVFTDIKMVNRVLRDTSRPDPSIDLFGKTQGLPLIITPTGVTSWVYYEGEVALARAAAKYDIPFTLTSMADTPMEELPTRAPGATLFYQATVHRNHEYWFKGIQRAIDAGYEALFLTMDSVMGYNRPRDERAKLRFPMNVRPGQLLETVRHPRWSFSTPARYLLTRRRLPAMNNILFPPGTGKHNIGAHLRPDDSLTWDFVNEVRKFWPNKLIIKGIMHPDDAVAAIEHGADAIVVSNHGGATNDAAPSTLEVLPGIAAAVAGRVPILVDSGYRRGTDVLKAIALGATAVMIGRATLFGLGAGGQPGAERALEIFRKEITRMMAVLGVSRISEIGRDHVVLPGDLAHLGLEPAAWKGQPAKGSGSES